MPSQTKATKTCALCEAKTACEVFYEPNFKSILRFCSIKHLTEYLIKTGVVAYQKGVKHERKAERVDDISKPSEGAKVLELFKYAKAKRNFPGGGKVA